jgi:hypothetical protein
MRPVHRGVGGERGTLIGPELRAIPLDCCNENIRKN